MRLTTSTVLLLALAAPAPGQQPTPDLARVDFNRDIRPILADRCFACHGFDARARKAGLRLDTWQGLTAERDGGVRPVVPGAPEQSEMVRRTHAPDPGDRMPPPKSGLSLDDGERALLRRWIAEGAAFEAHWAFVPPEEPPLPQVEDLAWAHNEVDAFVQARLARQGLAPSPEADRATLARRLSFDLTGLPPSPELLDAFLADREPGAYERLVDQLLASPHFGERMALQWLDAARYADTNGFHHDNLRTAWPYRDWVIEAFNQNMPFDRFALLQLAGDLLPDATVAQRIASGFCRMHNINDEGGALDDEYRVEAVADRIETISTTFMALTFTCARCHDHKYDPIEQEDYYSLFAYFNSVDERGVYGANFEQARAYPARLDVFPPEAEARLALARDALAAAETALAGAAPEIDAERAGFERGIRERRGVEWVDAELVEATSERGLMMRLLADGSVLTAAETPPDAEAHTFVLRTDALGLRVLRFEALADPSLPKESVSLASHGNAVVSHIRAEAVSVADPTRTQAIEWAWAWADHEQPNGDFDVLNALDPDAHGWALAGHQRIEDRTALLLAREPFGFEGGTLVRVTVDYKSQYPGHVVGRPRVSLARAARDLREDFPVVMSDWWLAGPFRGAEDQSFDRAYDDAFGPESVDGIDRDQKFGGVGWKHKPDFTDGKVHALRGERAAFYLGRTLHTPVARTLSLALGSDDSIKVFLNGEQLLESRAMRGAKPDQEQVDAALRPGQNTLVLKVVNNGGPAGYYFAATALDGALHRLGPAALLPQARRHENLTRAFANDWARQRSQLYAELDDAVRAARSAVAEAENLGVPVLVMAELEQPRPAFVLDRGRYDMVNEQRPVQRRPPMLLGGTLPDGAPNDRLGFAQWLTRPDHPLFPRVRVNRLWQLLFGTGLVKTTENFGMQSDWPSHPELLDWLAVRFAESGFDQKALLKTLVTSATYRQQSARVASAAAVDPENRLLAYFPRRRLAGEMIRDQALAVAGLLRDQIGGPSVRPYQPPGLWREVSIGGSSNTQVFERDDGDALYRRSLYTFWKRTSPNPQMMTFDAPTREYCVVRRSATNTPLQALVLWNDVQFLEAARVLAQRTLHEATDSHERLVAMFQRCTGREPDAGDLSVLQRTLAQLRQRYADAPADAEALVSRGEAPHDPELAATELAPWMLLASAILSLDDTLVKS